MDDDGIRRNVDRASWDWLEGRTPAPPGTPSNVVKFPVEPPAHIATSQRIAADAGIMPTITVPTPAPATPEHAARLFMRAARSALSKFLAGEWLSDEEARYLEALDEMRRQGPKP